MSVGPVTAALYNINQFFFASGICSASAELPRLLLFRLVTLVVLTQYIYKIVFYWTSSSDFEIQINGKDCFKQNVVLYTTFVVLRSTYPGGLSGFRYLYLVNNPSRDVISIFSRKNTGGQPLRPMFLH